MNTPDSHEIESQVKTVLAEDVGKKDVTAALIPAKTHARAELISREPAIICGRAWVDAAFKLMDANIQLQWQVEDGQSVSADQKLCDISGNARAILTAERTALNFMQTLSATATLTHQYVNAIKGTGCKILDTRKTIPGLRLAQKYAVLCGGGMNHRTGLYDMILIKENHIHAASSIAKAVEQAKKNTPHLKIEIEVENMDELQQAIAARVDRILLDNMSLSMLEEAVKITNKRIELEASGNMTLETIHEVASTGVDYISTGAITKNITAIDLSLRFISE